MEKDLQVVGFRIGAETYGVRIGSVREIVRVPEITSVPSAPDLIEGVINLRGKIIPVMDLRKRFGQTEIHSDKKNRILVVELENKLVGLIVNAASEVLKIPPSEIEAPGSVFADGESSYVIGVGKLKGRLIILLDIAKLLHRAEFKRFEEVAEPVAAKYREFEPFNRARALPDRRARTMGTLTAQIQLTEAELKLLQTLVYQECGMFFDERRSHFLKDRLQRRLKACQLDSFYSYYRLLTSREGRAELALLLENLTVNETSFFRNRPQLELLQKSVLEEILKHKQERRDWNIRIWSAGCSTGQEPYSVAMLICDALAYYYLRNPLPFEMPSPKPLIPPPWKLEIVASDISYASLRTAQEGVYTEVQMEPVDYTTRLRYFEKTTDKYAIKPQLKEVVQFDFHNLKTEFLPRRNDIILCRNVMIYFDEAEQKRLIEKFWNCLNSGGYLFVGHAESLFGLTQKFRMVHQNNGTAYQKIEAIA